MWLTARLAVLGSLFTGRRVANHPRGFTCTARAVRTGCIDQRQEMWITSCTCVDLQSLAQSWDVTSGDSDRSSLFFWNSELLQSEAVHGPLSCASTSGPSAIQYLDCRCVPTCVSWLRALQVSQEEALSALVSVGLGHTHLRGALRSDVAPCVARCAWRLGLKRRRHAAKEAQAHAACDGLLQGPFWHKGALQGAQRIATPNSTHGCGGRANRGALAVASEQHRSEYEPSRLRPNAYGMATHRCTGPAGWKLHPRHTGSQVSGLAPTRLRWRSSSARALAAGAARRCRHLHAPARSAGLLAPLARASLGAAWPFRIRLGLLTPRPA
jgi:hypothetical protein